MHRLSNLNNVLIRTAQGLYYSGVFAGVVLFLSWLFIWAPLSDKQEHAGNYLCGSQFEWGHYLKWLILGCSDQSTPNWIIVGIVLILAAIVWINLTNSKRLIFLPVVTLFSMSLSRVFSIYIDSALLTFTFIKTGVIAPPRHNKLTNETRQETLFDLVADFGNPNKHDLCLLENICSLTPSHVLLTDTMQLFTRLFPLLASIALVASPFLLMLLWKQFFAKRFAFQESYYAVNSVLQKSIYDKVGAITVQFTASNIPFTYSYLSLTGLKHVLNWPRYFSNILDQTLLGTDLHIRRRILTEFIVNHEIAHIKGGESILSSVSILASNSLKNFLKVIFFSYALLFTLFLLEAVAFNRIFWMDLGLYNGSDKIIELDGPYEIIAKSWWMFGNTVAGFSGDWSYLIPILVVLFVLGYILLIQFARSCEYRADYQALIDLHNSHTISRSQINQLLLDMESCLKAANYWKQSSSLSIGYFVKRSVRSFLSVFPSRFKIDDKIKLISLHPTAGERIASLNKLLEKM